MNLRSDYYRTFRELFENEQEGKDFRIRKKVRNSGILIMAPHGGSIESCTSEVAEAIGGDKYSFYSFDGLKPDSGNWNLHITSIRYDEPSALSMIADARIVIAIHGFLETKNCVVLGGLHESLIAGISEKLRFYGFSVNPPDTRTFPGNDPKNICNQGRLKKGVQIEMSTSLRDMLLTDNERLHLFSGAIRDALESLILV